MAKKKPIIDVIHEEVRSLRDDLNQLIKLFHEHHPSAKTKQAQFEKLVSQFEAYVTQQQEIGEDPQRLSDWLRPVLCFDPNMEVIAFIYLDGQMRVLATDMHMAGPCGGNVNYQDVIRKAVKLDCNYVVSAHSHAADGIPSDADIEAHDKLTLKLSEVGVNYVDTIIVTRKSARTPTGYTSLREQQPKDGQ